VSDTPNDRPFRWYAAEKIARLEAEIEDLKDDKRVFLSHLNLLADLLTPDQAAKARKLLDATPRMEFLSKTLTLQNQNAALVDALKTALAIEWIDEENLKKLTERLRAVMAEQKERKL